MVVILKFIRLMERTSVSWILIRYTLLPYGTAKNLMTGTDCQWIEAYGDQELDLDELFGIFYAKVKTNELYIGLLPVRTKTGIIFPNGKFEGT